MRTMILNGIGPIESSPLSAADRPEPRPAAGELLVRVRCCAVCRTDLHIIEGEVPPPRLPLVPGHQVVGRIDAVGEGCSARWKVGDRVGIAWLRHTCGRCEYCAAGRENLCPNSQYTGLHADGGYAEFTTVPEDFAYVLPEVFDDVSAAPLLCAGIIGYRAMKRARVQSGSTLAIFGFGSSAHVVLQLARHRRCEVFVVSRSTDHQQLARNLGAAWVGSDASKMPQRAHSTIVFAPAGSIVPEAMQSIVPGGTVALAGIHMSPIPRLDYARDLFGERDLHPVTANTRDDARELLQEAAAAGVRPHTTQYELAEANRAVLDMKQGRIDGTGVLMCA